MWQAIMQPLLNQLQNALPTILWYKLKPKWWNLLVSAITQLLTPSKPIPEPTCVQEMMRPPVAQTAELTVAPSLSHTPAPTLVLTMAPTPKMTSGPNTLTNTTATVTGSDYGKNSYTDERVIVHIWARTITTRSRVCREHMMIHRDKGKHLEMSCFLSKQITFVW